MRDPSRYTARIATTDKDVDATQRLRHRCFYDARGLFCGGRDLDRFDATCAHLMVEEQSTKRIVATCRLMPLGSGAQIAESYSAQFYDLSALSAYDQPIVEMGRFCVCPDTADPDVIRMAWAAVTSFVDDYKAGLLIGCSSFEGTDPVRYRDAFAQLARRHLAPLAWAPGIKWAEVVRFAARQIVPDPRKAMSGLPPLLKSYLAMGGWVSDHAVIDRDLSTTHVFTGLEVATIPPARKRALRALADQNPLDIPRAGR